MEAILDRDGLAVDQQRVSHGVDPADRLGSLDRLTVGTAGAARRRVAIVAVLIRGIDDAVAAVASGPLDLGTSRAADLACLFAVVAFVLGDDVAVVTLFARVLVFEAVAANAPAEPLAATPPHVSAGETRLR